MFIPFVSILYFHRPDCAGRGVDNGNSQQGNRKQLKERDNRNHEEIRRRKERLDNPKSRKQKKDTSMSALPLSRTAVFKGSNKRNDDILLEEEKL